MPPARILLLLLAPIVGSIAPASASDETRIFTPPGFSHAGRPAVALRRDAAHLEIVVIDASTKRPTSTRLNVVGPDGNFYQPAENRLSRFSLTGEWPGHGKANRQGKGPFRYLGRFFYSTGTVSIDVPPGPIRIEAWKGFEFAPGVRELSLKPRERRRVELTLSRTADVKSLGYDSGDTHLHFLRRNAEEEAIIFDLLAAEDIRYGTPLGYNEPAGPYNGVREILDYPQLLGLGAKSEKERDGIRILSGQEYRSGTYGHLNLYLRDDLVREGEKLNANDWPLYGMVGRETKERGGFAIHAHGGYAQSIYADFVQGDVDAVELLQFAVYRGIELQDWYHILNTGYRFPIVGASDYPACRKLGDCLTYVLRHGAPQASPPDMKGWMTGMAKGRSFVTTGPMLLLDVEGSEPGSIISLKDGESKKSARVRVMSPTAPVDRVQVIANGKVVSEVGVPAGQGVSSWFETSLPVDVSRSTWIATRAFNVRPADAPDAEAHTNPIYLDHDGKAAYSQASLDAIVARLDGQMAKHRARNFKEKAKVLDYFQTSRDILMKIRAAGGLPTAGVPAEWKADLVRSKLDPSARTHDDAELAEFLKPVPPKTIADAIKTFETTGGFHLDLLASEPLLRSPVAGAYDEDGRLYIAEMTDYPYKPRDGQTPLGSIRLLIDKDGDGKFDESHVFATGLLWAAGIAPWKGGVFVTSPPDIWYMKDTDGDHKADVRVKLFTGFGTGNEQGMLNNLTFGLDHKVYGSTSVNGGLVTRVVKKDGPGIDVKGRDFRFDPNTFSFEPITGTVQFGNSFDDDGNRFLCSESRPILHAVLPLDALARNPYLPVATGLESVSTNPVPIFRISPLERWRQIRSSRRIAHGERSADAAGASHHVIDAAAGVTIYRGSAYPAEYYGNAFVPDAQNNLIHRMRLIPQGPTFKGERADAGAEFVRSSDTWFRPVNLINAPDGTLHALDMSRETIEAIHIPNDVVKHLDLRRGRDQGRLYRIAPTGFQGRPQRRLSECSTVELVVLLKERDSWARDTAHRLIFERQDKTAIPHLRELLLDVRADTTARIHALWSLEGLGSLTADPLLASLSITTPRLAAQAAKLAEGRLGSDPRFLDALMKLAASNDVRLRFQVALSLGASTDARAASALAAIARRDLGDNWTRLAVLSSSAPFAGRMFEELARDTAFLGSSQGQIWLEALLAIVGARNDASDRHRSITVIHDVTAGHARRWSRALARGLRSTGQRFALVGPDADVIESWWKSAEQVARDGSQPEAARIEAIGFLSSFPLGHVQPTFALLLRPGTAGPIQAAAIRTLGTYNDPEIVPSTIGGLQHLAPQARVEAFNVLLSREPWTLAMLRNIRSGNADPLQIDPVRRSALLSHRNREIAELAKAVLPTPVNARLVDSFAPSLRLKGDRARGSVVFDKLCVTCHKVGEKGKNVGPDLSATQFTDAENLLMHILDPNRYVAPNYAQYLISDVSGRVYQGLIASETASSLTLVGSNGEPQTILRSQIEQMRDTGKSLMPEDLGSKLSQQEAADLVAFLLQSRAAAKLDVGTLPGLYEPDEK